MQEAAERLTAAFTAAGSRSVNIFGMAEVRLYPGSVTVTVIVTFTILVDVSGIWHLDWGISRDIKLIYVAVV